MKPTEEPTNEERSIRGLLAVQQYLRDRDGVERDQDELEEIDYQDLITDILHAARASGNYAEPISDLRKWAIMNFEAEIDEEK